MDIDQARHNQSTSGIDDLSETLTRMALLQVLAYRLDPPTAYDDVEWLVDAPRRIEDSAALDQQVELRRHLGSGSASRSTGPLRGDPHPGDWIQQRLTTQTARDLFGD